LKLTNAEALRLVPAFMRTDGAVQGLAGGVDLVTHALAQRLKLLRVWDQLDRLTDGELDELAWELDVAWYDSMAAVDVKRRVIRQSDQVHARLGTKWAVEQVVDAYFGSAEVAEWFTYGGQPHRFKVRTTDPATNRNMDIDRLLALLDTVKRKSAWLDTVEVSLTGAIKLCARGRICGDISQTILPEYEIAYDLTGRVVPVCAAASVTTTTLPELA